MNPLPAVLVVLASLSLAAPPLIAQPRPLDPVDFQVNTYTTGAQFLPSVARDPAGNFTVAWTSDGSDGGDSSGSSIQARRFSADGSPFDLADIQVNTYTTSDQYSPSLATDPGGNFIIVVWASLGSDGDDTSEGSVQARRFTAYGYPLDPAEFQVNTYTNSYQENPALAVDAGANFLVVWHSFGSTGSDGSDRSIQARRFAYDGSPLDPVDFQVNTYTADRQWRSAVAVDRQGNFVVVWQSARSAGSDGDSESIQARRFAADGSPLDPADFQVNTYTTGSQRRPAVATDPQGNFVVVWQSYGSSGSDNSGWSIQAQRYDAAGAALGGQFQVNTQTTSAQERPAVAVDSRGDFVVAWESYASAGGDTSGASVQARRFFSDGDSLDPADFQVNTYTPTRQASPAVAMDPQGNFVVVWQSAGSAGSDGDSESIQARRFAGSVIFDDGFESGDLTRWSASVP